MATDISTYFTQIGGTRLVHSAQTWMKITLELETAGPVAVGTRDDLQPVLSGKGILLTLNEQQVWVMEKGDRLFATSQTINRVKMIIEPIPWQGKIDGSINSGFSTLMSLMKKLAARKKSPSVATPQIPCPPGTYLKR